MALSPGWVMGADILRRLGSIYRVAVSDAIRPSLTLTGMRPIHIIPQLWDIEYDAHGRSRSLRISRIGIIGARRKIPLGCLPGDGYMSHRIRRAAIILS